MEIIKESSGSQLKKLRMARGITQLQAARAVGIAPAQLCRYEQGKHTPRQRTMQRLKSFYQSVPESKSSARDSIPCQTSHIIRKVPIRPEHVEVMLDYCSQYMERYGKLKAGVIDKELFDLWLDRQIPKTRFAK